MEVDGSSARSAESWPKLVEDPTAIEPVSPRSLLARGPITRAARPKRSTTPPPTDPELQPAVTPPAVDRRALLYWRAGVIGVVASIAAALLIVANKPPAPSHADEPLAAVGAASPETATALEPKPAPPEVALDQREALAEEVLFIEDDLDEDPPEPAAVDAQGAARSASRARARDAARVLTGRARTRRATGDTAGAVKLLEDALKALPTYAPAAADLATIHIHRGDYRRALTYAKQAQRSSPRKLGYMVLLGDAHSLNGSRASAQLWWRRAAEFGSTKAEERLAKHGR